MDSTEEIEQFFSLNRKGVFAEYPAYWTLYETSKKHPIATNYDTVDVAESLEELMQHLQVHSNVLKMTVKLKKTKGDNTPTDKKFMNPFYINTRGGSGVGIGGFGGSAGGGTMAIIGILQTQSTQHNEMMMQMQKQQAKSDKRYAELKYSHEIGELKGEIVAIQEQQKGWIGLIMKEVLPLVKEFGPIVIGQMMGGQEQPITGVAEQAQAQEQEPQQPAKDIQVLTEGLRLLKNVFSNPEQVVLDFGRLAAADPKQAALLYEMIKKEANGAGGKQD